MLNESLKEVQSESVRIADCGAHVSDTGITSKASANLGVDELARQRFQRMRRRRARASSSRRLAGGWVARMA